MVKAKRNIGQGILDGAREMKRGEYARDGSDDSRNAALSEASAP